MSCYFACSTLWAEEGGQEGQGSKLFYAFIFCDAKSGWDCRDRRAREAATESENDSDTEQAQNEQAHDSIVATVVGVCNSWEEAAEEDDGACTVL